MVFGDEWWTVRYVKDGVEKHYDSLFVADARTVAELRSKKYGRAELLNPAGHVTTYVDGEEQS